MKVSDKLENLMSCYERTLKLEKMKRDTGGGRNLFSRPARIGESLVMFQWSNLAKNGVDDFALADARVSNGIVIAALQSVHAVLMRRVEFGLSACQGWLQGTGQSCGLSVADDRPFLFGPARLAGVGFLWFWSCEVR